MEKIDFLTRLNYLIKSAVPYVYPETKNDYYPNYESPVLLETSYFKNRKVLNRARRHLKRMDLKGLEWTYNNLDDEYSRDMMLKVIVYKLFDEVKIRFPLCYDYTLPKLDELEQKMKIDDEEINLWMDIIKLKKYNLNKIDYDAKLWLNIEGLFISFIKEQYRYKNILKIEPGDIVIDGGACYGDTAIYFSAKGAKKVYSFEFLKENLDIFDKNINMNPQYKDKIELIQKPLSDKSGEKLYAVSNGPGTSVTNVYSDGAEEFETITIDDLVAQNNIEKIDFIKLDVECSEAAVLKGAINTIRKFKPKLAICVYHKKDDLWTIPQLIKEILPEYKFYLDHHTINLTETVLYGKV